MDILPWHKTASSGGLGRRNQEASVVERIGIGRTDEKNGIRAAASSREEADWVEYRCRRFLAGSTSMAKPYFFPRMKLPPSYAQVITLG